ncbi:MAG: glutaminase [Campylobacterota bacterium]|nr:glutaminase [Campylobacterota bacterium]
MNYSAILEQIQTDVAPLLGQGKVATYIPALACADPHDFAMSLQLVSGESYHIGLHNKTFSIQSISKIFMYEMALNLFEESILGRVNVEPSGNPFNSLIQLEYENGIPRNPFINPGAIVIADMLTSYFKEKSLRSIIDFVQICANDASVSMDESIAESEHSNGYRNYALANLMKSFGNIKNDVESVLNTYFNCCSIAANTAQLARSILHLAHQGTDPLTSLKHLSPEHTKRINALMLTCGHYDASGEFAYRIGLPGKSGVGGGIVTTVPSIMSIAVYSPALNKHGNSLAGTKALELFSKYTGHSIF